LTTQPQSTPHDPAVGAEVKERPILFSTPAIRPIFEDRKVHTRRTVKFPASCRGEVPEHYLGPDAYGGHVFSGVNMWGGQIDCPYGKPGDRLWVKENYRFESKYDHLKPSKVPQGSPVWYEANINNQLGQASHAIFMPNHWGRLRRSIFMPRWASRITLEVKAVKVERLQDISEEDAIKEGIPKPCEPLKIWSARTWLDEAHTRFGNVSWLGDYDGSDDPDKFDIRQNGLTEPDKAVDSFKYLWDSINAKSHPWADNPFVWVVEFARLNPIPGGSNDLSRPN